jgi:hypothetical protein
MVTKILKEEEYDLLKMKGPILLRKKEYHHLAKDLQIELSNLTGFYCILYTLLVTSR